MKKEKVSKKDRKSPFIFKIKKMNDNKELIKSPELLKHTLEFSPLSGSEPVYNPDKWNKNPNIRQTHNCYSYALGKVRSGLDSKAQPGYASGYNHVSNESYECESFYKRLKRDVPGSYLEVFDKKCHPGFYKIYLMLDKGNDYHWARQDSNMYWSHKPGSTEVVNVDASGKSIKNPVTANWKYESLNYDTPCFFACIYSDLSRSMSKIYGDKYSF